MKPWEETWEAEAAQFYVADTDGSRLHVIAMVEEEEDYATQFARFELAAAAPEMARMLGRLAAAYGWQCKWCEGEAPHPYRGAPVKHEDGCELEAILRKAGVLP